MRDVVSPSLLGFATLNRNLRTSRSGTERPLSLWERAGVRQPQPPNYALINSGAVPR